MSRVPSLAPIRDRLRAATTTLIGVALLLLPIVALAAEDGEVASGAPGGHAGAADHHEPSPSGLVFPIVNFAIYAFILWKYAWPAVRSYLYDRRENTVTALAAAKEVKAEAEALKAEYDAKLRNLEEEAKKARAEVLETAELEAKNMVEQAKKSAERIRNDARLVADEEVARARRELREESAALVAKLAGEIVSRQVGPADQARFVTEFVSQARADAGRAGGSR
ncbi:MAG: ATP synthase F0 subunit B [Alphaproteobacteria bacterium]